LKKISVVEHANFDWRHFRESGNPLSSSKGKTLAWLAPSVALAVRASKFAFAIPASPPGRMQIDSGSRFARPE